MKKLVYPIILTKHKDYYEVEFLDFIGEIYTNGGSIYEALENAREAFSCTHLKN